MQYRTFGRSDWQASVLGFGCMRLPTRDGVYGSDQIDEEKAARLIYTAIDGGVNYIDTAYTYHHGESERFLGRILQGDWRKKVHIASKLPAWKVETHEDFDRILADQLEKLQTERIDIYLLHSLNHDSFQKIYDLGVLDWAERRLAEGRIGQLGFSFHDKYDVFKTIVDAYDRWSFCQIQYNYMNTNYQAGTRGLQYAHGRGMAVVIMEPLLGGKLAKMPAEALSLLQTSPVKRTPAEWALQWVWSQPEVNVVLSGMNGMEQVEQNLASAGRSRPGLLTPVEQGLLAQVREIYEKLCPIPCTGCNYCQPCPNKVRIPYIFELFNNGRMYDSLNESRYFYESFMAEDERASNCVECRQCEAVCPQGIAITQWLAEADRVLGRGEPYSK